MKLTTTRYLPGEIRAYHVSRSMYGPLKPAAIYRVECSDKELNHAVAPNLDRVVYTTPHSVVCSSQNSDLLWHYALEPRSTQRHLRDCNYVFSLDGAWVWMYRPDADYTCSGYEPKNRVCCVFELFCSYGFMYSGS